MFRIYSEKNFLKVELTYGKELGNWVTTLSQEYHHEVDAKLRVRHFDEQLEKKLEAIRREAYAQGWKDAKAKTVRQTWFSRWW